MIRLQLLKRFGHTMIRSKLIVPAALLLSASAAHAQWHGSMPPVNTYTLNDNVGIGTGPVADARLKIMNSTTDGIQTPLNWNMPAFIIQRENNMGLGGPALKSYNIMEVWRQDYVGGWPSGANKLKFVIDSGGRVGINKNPSVHLDVADDANVDGSMEIGIAKGFSSANNVLTLHGNVLMTRPSDGQYRTIKAQTNLGALSFLANTKGEDGPSIVLNGIGAAVGSPGAVTMSSYGTGSSHAYEFNNFDPAGGGTWTTMVHISSDGKMVIGDNSLPKPAGYRLYVDDGILTRRLKIALPSDPTNWSDFVFADDYQLRPLKEVESYIAKHKHLPEIPSTEEVHKDGLDVAQMNAKLLQKVEELTLYVIQQQKDIEALKKRK